MKIISWNILQGGGKRAAAIRDAISQWSADIVVLQEYRHGASSLMLSDSLSEQGLVHQFSSADKPGKNCVFIASRNEIQCDAWAVDLGTTLAVHVKCGAGDDEINLFAAHLPHKRAQVPYFEALLDRKDYLSENSLIIGDLNCGIPFEDSDTKTFANTHLFQALLQQGWIDCWRTRHPDAKEFTWISNKGNGYRYDHSLCSSSIDERLITIEYDHDVRESGLSDHSAMILELQ